MSIIEINNKQYRLITIQRGNGQMVGKIACDYCDFGKDDLLCANPLTHDCMDDLNTYWKEVDD
jgi:hypothetical protein